MNQRLALLIATGLSTFLLVTGGAIAGRITQAQDTPTPTAVPTEDVMALLQAREAEYQQLLAQARTAPGQASQAGLLPQLESLCEAASDLDAWESRQLQDAMLVAGPF